MKKLIIAFILSIPLLSAISHAGQKSSVKFLNSGAVLPKDKSLPFSEAVRAGNTIYLSGQIGVIPGTLKLVEGGIQEEAKQTMNNIKASLEANNLSMENIVKCTIMLADISEWSSFNEVYITFFTEPYPARSAFGSSGLALGARTEVECLAIDY